MDESPQAKEGGDKTEEAAKYFHALDFTLHLGMEPRAGWLWCERGFQTMISLEYSR